MLPFLPLRSIALRPLHHSRRSQVIFAPQRKQQPFSSSPSSTGGSSSSGNVSSNNPQQKRANQLHNEIENIMKKHDRRHEEEAKKALRPAGFLEFLGQHKTNITVIVVSFLTVVLSVKLVQTKKKYKELEKELINTQGQVDQKRNLLKAITDQSFVHEMATKCTKEVNNKTSNVFSFWGRSSSKANMEAQISSVLETQLNNLIGDEGLTEDEKNAKQFEELKQDNGSEIDKIKALTMENSTKEEEGIQIEMMDDASGNKVVKKSVFRI